MPIITIQQRMTEVGRIRLGEQVPTKGGRTRPSRLDRFRLTSHSRPAIESAADVYGGTVNPWQSPAGPQWQLTIEADALEVIVAPGESFSQWFELWSGGGCERRCDGVALETFKGRDVRDQGLACACPRDTEERVAQAAEGAACKPTTRLAVWLPRLAGIGVWRAETHGFYAAAELPGVVGLLQGLAAQGYRPVASMRIATRTVKRPGSATKTFPVLELDLPDVTLSGLLGAGAALPGEAVAVLGPGGGPQGPAGPRQLGPGAQGPGGFDEPPTGRRPARGERVTRPGTGTPPELPAESTMRRPAPAGPRSSPEPGNAPLPFPVDDDEDAPSGRLEVLEAGAPLTAGKLAGHLEAIADPAAAAGMIEELEAEVPGLTFDELRARIRSELLLPDELVAMVKADPATYGEAGSFRDLTDAQRGRLYVDAIARRA